MMLDKLGLPSDFDAWTARKAYAGHGLPHGQGSERVKALLNIGWGKRLRSAAAAGRNHAELAQGWYCDVTQAVEREPWGPLGALLQTSYKYTYEGDFVLTGTDHLSIHGFPGRVLGQARRLFSDAEIRSLAGESFNLPCVGTIVAAYYMNPFGPWWQESK